MKKIYYYDTYAGRVGIAEEDGAITNIIFSDSDWPKEETKLIKNAKAQLDEYFEGKRTDFDFPTRLEGTEFQKSVWNALRKIPYGKTVTYKYIAESVGCPQGFRAVGLANNKNPISIVYPCHRVIGSDGSLTGYGGGLDVKAKLLELERKYSSRRAVGVDIGGTNIKIGIFEKNGDLVIKTQIPTRREDNFGHILEDAADEIISLLKKTETENVVGIGIGIPGPVLGGVVLHCANLHWESKVDAARIMERLTGIKSFLLNDANAAALGEQWKGGAMGKDSMLLVTIGTGIGGGVVIGGKVMAGTNGAGGEIGHIIVENRNGRKCNCGRWGCLETYTSATGIVRTAEELLAKNDKSVLLKRNVTAKSIFDAAAENDEIALKTVETFSDYLGMALANIAVTIDPEVIVLGGGVANAKEIVRKSVEKAYRKYAFKAVKNTEIVVAKLGNDAGIYGAAKSALNIF